MLKKLLRKPKKTPSTISSLEKLNETLELLEKKEFFYRKKITSETEKAKDFTKLKNKKAAIQCLKRKKLYEAQVEQLGNFQLRVHDQMITLEGAKATKETVDALRVGASTMNSIQLCLDVDKIDKTMEEVTKYEEHIKQIQENLAAPTGNARDIDEDELEAELEELEEAELEELEEVEPEEQPVHPTMTVPATVSHIKTRDKSVASASMDELATLQAEMAL
ncbi:vacuolar protein sorting-associated protein 32 homolog 1-like [Aristolochia californica]|uniref:vacuolar protein sorting-associated protein 32 homolog 1-like n=1 Tax=Aristolochia californica TaxID=171875 RepID=UPI0035E27617